jgi:phosphate transport system permease protein
MNASVPVAAKPPRERVADWPLADRIGYGLCWAAGGLLCAIAVSVVGYMLYRGLQYLTPSLLWTRPEPTLDQKTSGGFLDPLIGTFLLTTIGVAIAGVIGVAVSVWLTEYGRPAWLGRLVESAIEVVAGTPSIVLAIFGLLVFQSGARGFLSFRAEGGGVFGRSFFAAGTMMSLIALPLVGGATREALAAIPRHVREASYALGKTRAATIWRVLLPASRPGIATGLALGMGRIAGDTAIVVILLGASGQITPEGGVAPFNVLRGTGSTLTSYVYNNSPAGEGNAPDKAYAAAFVLLVIVVALNFVVGLIRRGSGGVGWIR